MNPNILFLLLIFFCGDNALRADTGPKKIHRISKRAVGFGDKGDSTRENLISVVEYDTSGKVIEENTYGGYWTRGAYQYGLERSGYWKYGQYTYNDELDQRTVYYYNKKGLCDSVRFYNAKGGWCEQWWYHDSTGRYLGFDGCYGVSSAYSMSHERVFYNTDGTVFKDYHWTDKPLSVDSVCYIMANKVVHVWYLGNPYHISHNILNDHDTVVSETRFDAAAGGWQAQDSVNYVRDPSGRLLREENFFNSEIFPKVKWQKGDVTSYSYDASLHLSSVVVIMKGSVTTKFERRYSYDSSGRIIKVSYFANDDLTAYELYYYDLFGALMEWRSYDGNNNIVNKELYAIEYY